MTGAIFLEQITKGKIIYTRYELHVLTDKGYYIKNVAYASKNREMQGSEINLADVDEWKDIMPEATFPGIDRPLFAYFKVPQANNVDPSSPLGVSVYSRAKNLIKEADRQYSRMLWEFEGGELAIDADEMVFRQDESTGKKELPKGKERLFRLLNFDAQSGDSKSLIPFAPELRDKSFINGLNKLLQRIEFNCGLAYGTLSDPQNIDKTATEIKISRQRSYATVADIQKALQSAIENLIYAMDAWATIGNLAPEGKYETSYEWDDSIIVDSESEQRIRMDEVAAGTVKPEFYLMWRYGVTEDQAREIMPGMEQLTTDTPNDEVAKNAAVSKAEDVAGKTLNGAQTQSLISVIAQYQAGQLTIGQAINIIAVAIGVTKEEAKKILEGAE
jgi:A118 family predicted phage portal protein